jgi:hypothetical protein
MKTAASEKKERRDAARSMRCILAMQRGSVNELQVRAPGHQAGNTTFGMLRMRFSSVPTHRPKRVSVRFALMLRNSDAYKRRQPQCNIVPSQRCKRRNRSRIPTGTIRPMDLKIHPRKPVGSSNFLPARNKIRNENAGRRTISYNFPVGRTRRFEPIPRYIPTSRSMRTTA